MKKLLIIASLASISESPFAMTNEHPMKPTTRPETTSFRFHEHKFSALCFNTKGCRVEYAKTYDVNDPDDKTTPPPPSDMLTWVSGGRLGISNFPEPAKISWRSLDGSKHSASIDIGKIFHDECVVHDIPSEKIAKNKGTGTPSIILIVNDREISVYMKTLIPLKTPERSDNPFSNVALATKLAYRQAYR
ncbi:hypothetical protein [Luteibacter sp.]|uniref:hypothetical protein n=1 Tax=Luteibacter sp. TaxID=1886636 RepID=UPI0025BD6F25|nr:hypothetical protein [Luteibacter sp.]